MEEEVDTAYSEAARLVSFHSVPMAIAADQAMPDCRRVEIITALQDQPLHLQHQTVRNIEIMRGAVLNARGDAVCDPSFYGEAYKCYQRAASIAYASTGCSYLYMKDLWRLVGSSMRCGKRDDAVAHLSKIRRMLCFTSMGSDANEAFCDLTLKYAPHWWNDQYDPRVKHQLLCMAADVNKRVQSKAEPKNIKPTNKKKKNRRK